MGKNDRDELTQKEMGQSEEIDSGRSGGGFGKSSGSSQQRQDCRRMKRVQTGWSDKELGPGRL